MNRFFLAMILFSLLFLFAQIAMKANSDKTEQPNYVVLEKFENFEIRKYPELFVAKTKLSASGYDGNSKEGFRKVAGYIFGANDANKKIAMTSPVIMDMKDSVEMSFIMPSEINSNNAPTPTNTNVTLQKRPEQIIAVLTFSGWANTEKIAKKEKELIQLLKNENIDYFGEVSYLGYNPPYQLIDRKNEISIQINYKL